MSSLRRETSVAWVIRAMWITYAAALFTFTHIPIPEPVADVTSAWDKLIHCGAYFILTVLTVLVFLRANPLRFPFASVCLGLILFAAFDEAMQGPVGRNPELADWIFDCIGVLAGVLFSQLTLALANVWGWRCETLLGETSPVVLTPVFVETRVLAVCLVLDE